MQQGINCKRLITILLSLLLIFTMMPGMGMFTAETANAASNPVSVGSGTMELTGTDDNGTVYNGETAQLSSAKDKTYQNSNIYTFTVNLNNLSSAEGRKVSIELADGLQWVDYGDADTNFTGQIVGGTLEKKEQEPIMENYLALTPTFDYFKSTELDKDMLNIHDSRERGPIVTATLKEGATSLSWNFKVQLNMALWYSDISDAIKVTYEDQLEKKEISIDAKATYPKMYETTVREVPLKNNGTTKNDMASQLCQGDGGKTGALFLFTRPSWDIVCPEGITPKLMPEVAQYFDLTKDGDIYHCTVKDNWIVSTQIHGYLSAPILFDTNVNDTTKQYSIKITTFVELLNGERPLGDAGSVLNITARIASAEEEIFAQCWEPAGNARSHITRYLRNKSRIDTAYTFYMQEDEQVLGNIQIGNAGSKDSTEKTCVLTFDESIAKVKAVAIPIPQGNKVTRVFVKSHDYPDGKTVTVDEKVGYDSDRALFEIQDMYITAKELGLDDNDYIKEMSVDIGVIPAQYAVGREIGVCNKILGSAVDKTSGQKVLGTIEIKDTKGSGKTTGPIEIRSNFRIDGPHDARTLGINVSDTSIEPPRDNKKSASTVVMAGEESEYKSIRLSQQGVNIYYGIAKDYNVYIRVPENATLNVKKIRSGHLGNTDTSKNSYYIQNEKDITRLVRISKRLTSKDSEGHSIYYYKLSFAGVPAADKVLGLNVKDDGKVYDGGVYIDYSIKTSKNTPGGESPYNTSVFMELKQIAENREGLVTSSATAIKGNPYNFSTDGGKLFATVTEDRLVTVPSIVVLAKAESKTGEMENYVVYDESDPQTVLPIGVSEEDTVSMKVNVKNLSGVSAPRGTTVWFPLPKKGEDWGVLSKGSKTKDGEATTVAPYSLELKEKISNIDTNVWNIEYGKNIVPPAKFETGWDRTVAWESDITDADLKDVNMVKITAKENIPAYGADGNAWNEDIIATVAADPNHRQEKNSVLVACPLVYRDLTVNEGQDNEQRYEGIEAGEPTAMTIATGKIKGTVFADANKNGKWDSSEQEVDISKDGPYEVTLWGGAKGQRQKIATSYLNSNSEYRFNGVATDKVYDGYYSVQITNRDKNGKDFRGVNDGILGDYDMIVSPKDAGTVNGKGINNAFIHNTSASDPKLLGYAFSNPITAVEADGWNFSHGGNYNCGVFWKAGLEEGLKLTTTANFKIDAAKGTMRDRTQSAEWIEITKGTKGETASELEYEGIPGDSMIFPKVIAGEGQTFLGWVATDKDGAAIGNGMPRKNPVDVSFGYEAVYYTAAFSDDNEEIDKEALLSAIANAKKITGSDSEREKYTDETLTRLEEVIIAAEEVANAPSSTNEDYKRAKYTLDRAISGLKTPREALRDAVDRAKDIDPADFTDESMAVLGEAVTNAEDNLNDPSSTKEQLVQAIEQIDDAIDGLIPTREGLLKAAKDAEEMDVSDMTDESVSNLQDAIRNAYDKAADMSATNEDLKEAYVGLRQAIEGLKTKARDALEKAVARYDALDRPAYTKETIKVADIAAAKAKDILESGEEASKEELESAARTLNNALDALITKVDVAKSELEEKLKKAEAINKSLYTDATVQTLSDAIENAKIVLADDNATVEQVKSAESRLDDAVKVLVTKDAAALAKAKNDAKAELDKVDVNLYEEPELSVVKKAVEDGKKEIDASTTIPQVDAAKKKALDTVAAQKTAAQKAEEQKKQDEDPKNIPTEVTDKTPANLVAVTTAITTAKNDGDLKGSTYAPLKFMSKKQTKKSIKLQWSKVKGAKKYTVYANQCGTKNKYKKLATVKASKKSLNVKKVAGKKLKKATNYKFLIIAENGDKVSAISKTVHVRTAGHKKYTNYKSVSVKKAVIKKAKKLKKGKTLKLNAKGVVAKGKKVSVHVKTRYESANKKIATVTKAGKVKGIKKGKAKIYCYVQNGLAKVVTVTVK